MKSQPVAASTELSVVHTPDDAVPARAGRVTAPVRPGPGPWSRALSEVPLGLVICGVGLGLVIIALHHFRWGSLTISITVLGAALLRLVLPARRAGLLVVRSRFTDVLTMGITGGALMVLAAVTSS
jgi:hypothetical protein